MTGTDLGYKKKKAVSMLCLMVTCITAGIVDRRYFLFMSHVDPPQGLGLSRASCPARVKERHTAAAGSVNGACFSCFSCFACSARGVGIRSRTAGRGGPDPPHRSHAPRLRQRWQSSHRQQPRRKRKYRGARDRRHKVGSPQGALRAGWAACMEIVPNPAAVFDPSARPAARLLNTPENLQALWLHANEETCK